MEDKLDESFQMKWKRSLRKRLINCLARIENDCKPTQELLHELAKAKECFNYWSSDVADWEKHTYTFTMNDDDSPTVHE